MSISGISSIHGDNPLSDFSYRSRSPSSSRAGSVVLASSINLRKKLSRNSNTSAQTDVNNWVELEITRDSSRAIDASEQNSRVFENWIVGLNNRGQIVIEGKLERFVGIFLCS
jgi:hypothetical protein